MLNEIIERNGVCPWCEFEHIREEDFTRLFYNDELSYVIGYCGQCGKEFPLKEETIWYALTL